MIDWNAVEAARATVFDVVRTAFLVVAGLVAYVQLREMYRLRRLQTLSSFNERLARCTKANTWIDKPNLNWGELDSEIKYDYQNYIAVFEDIGAARKIGLLSHDDFIASNGGRFMKLHNSGTLHQFIDGAELCADNFNHLRILLKDIGQDDRAYLDRARSQDPAPPSDQLRAASA